MIRERKEILPQVNLIPKKKEIFQSLYITVQVCEVKKIFQKKLKKKKKVFFILKNFLFFISFSLYTRVKPQERKKLIKCIHIATIYATFFIQYVNKI